MDYADFRYLDATSETSQQLDRLPMIVNNGTVRAEFDAVRNLAELTDRLRDMDVHELARLGSRRAQQLDDHIDRRALLLKLSASLTLAAATPVITTATATPAHATTPSMGDNRFTGIWHSRYIYYSSGRKEEFEGEHYIVLRHQNGRLVG
jgi:hypothetical protein